MPLDRHFPGPRIGFVSAQEADAIRMQDINRPDYYSGRPVPGVLDW